MNECDAVACKVSQTWTRAILSFVVLCRVQDREGDSKLVDKASNEALAAV